MHTLREGLDNAYKTAAGLAKTDAEREEVRTVFRDLFKTAKQASKKGVRLPVPDPLGILTDMSKGGEIELFDPLFHKPAKSGDRLCDQLDDTEMTDFARTVCGEHTSENCIRAVYGYASGRKEGELDDEEFNKAVNRTLKQYGVVPKGDYAIMLKMRSPCMVEEILEMCGYDPECLDKFQKLAEAIDDPFMFQKELTQMQEML